MSRQNGIFIAFEGIDGAGNTTHSRLATEWLKNMGFDVILTKEPSPDGRIGQLVRSYLRDEYAHPAIDALLFAADRVEHVYKVVLPAIRSGKIVISDRYLESSIAYQSAQGLDVEWIKNINKFAIRPDLTIILDVEPEAALRRKGLASEKFERVEFLSKVRRNLLLRANEMGYPVIYTGLPLEKVVKAVRNVLVSYLRQREML